MTSSTRQTNIAPPMVNLMIGQHIIAALPCTATRMQAAMAIQSKALELPTPPALERPHIWPRERLVTREPSTDWRASEGERLGRCHGCRMAFVWTYRSGMPLAFIPCPVCGKPMKQTTRTLSVIQFYDLDAYLQDQHSADAIRAAAACDQRLNRNRTRIVSIYLDLSAQLDQFAPAIDAMPTDTWIIVRALRNASEAFLMLDPRFADLAVR